MVLSKHLVPGTLEVTLLIVLIIDWSHSQPAQNPLRHGYQNAQPQPCIDNCIVEALADDPVKGCAAGTVWEPYPLTAPEHACRPCPMGFYCTGNPYGECNYAGCNMPALKVNLNRKSACPIGTYIDYTGAQSYADCKECHHGYYQDWYGSPSCKPCPAGTYIDQNRSDSVHDCISCLAGHYCPLGSPVPIPCPAGLWTRYPRMRELANCLECPRGHYCPLGSVHPTPCPPRKWVNVTGTKGSGEYPGTYKTPGVMTGDSCRICPASFFCPIGSPVPTSCPPGTISARNQSQESDCTACPVGYKCELPLNRTTAQSLVVRDANGEQLVGAVTPVLCAVDTWNWHYSYPNLTGCVENCPYRHTHQSYCHVAGDGRVPDRNAVERRITDLIAQRATHGPAMTSERNEALAALQMELEAMTAADKIEILTMPNRVNARTPLILAAMLGDLPGMKLLWSHGAGSAQRAVAARDVGGLTALMHALQFGHTDCITWLTAATPTGAGATLVPSDTKVLLDRGVDITGIPVTPSLEVPPAYLGRGGVTWTHPSSSNFTVAPYQSNTDPKYADFYGGPER